MIRLGVSIRSKFLFFDCSEHSKRVRPGHNRSVPTENAENARRLTANALSFKSDSRTSLKRLAKDRKTPFNREQWRECQMRFSLVPERNGRKIVASPVGMAMFDRNANLFFEDYRVFNVETIDSYRVRPVRATASNDAVVGTVVDL